MDPVTRTPVRIPQWGIIQGLLLLQVLLSAWVILRYDGTGDSGDSVQHYLYARYAPVHWALYFDHWAKPFFVLLASPFAQAGFIGMKVFNALCALGSTWFTWRVAVRLGFQRAWLVAPALMAMPLHIALTFSGLTEPLFALLLIAAVERACSGRIGQAALLVSWLPYVRSEGLLLLGVFGLYLVMIRHWRAIPLLAAGSVAYSVAGYFVTHDLFWVVTHIPYARVASGYGSGTPFHFLDQLYYVVGLPLYVLFWLGVVDQLVRLFRRELEAKEGVLVLLSATVFIAAHSVFWAFGLFHSMGLKRVLLSVAPLLALIAVRGLERITGEQLARWPRFRWGLRAGVLVYIAVFPFTPNPAALDPARDLMLTQDQQLAGRVAERIRHDLPDHGRVLYEHPYLGEVLALDPFDPRWHSGLSALQSTLRHDDLVIWENWFSVVEGGVQRTDLDADPRLELLFEANGEDRGRPLAYAVYKVRQEVP